ncbi:hypothetical protein DPEC_G00350990 [Dallia pectoralis]|uniref:Uncharacterized protein n=1 Tax=Dallia pectoralis TaxID=75939 RepID=A0ACC2F1U8_DALPE|nr:hypothetical protein DPEC_G00350990 [Dallia pectoralis]
MKSTGGRVGGGRVTAADRAPLGPRRYGDICVEQVGSRRAAHVVAPFPHYPPLCVSVPFGRITGFGMEMKSWETHRLPAPTDASRSKYGGGLCSPLYSPFSPTSVTLLYSAPGLHMLRVFVEHVFV